MARFAALLMFLAWLLFGTMPVMASPPAMGAMVAGHSHTQASEHTDMENHASAEVPVSGAAKVHGGTNCIAASCAACLTILPRPPVSGAFASNLSYRLATFAPAFRAGRPAPPERPPRIRMF